MVELIQHCFECRTCSARRPCFIIYVDSAALDFRKVEEHVKEISCGRRDVNFQHKYSIPYVEDGD